MRFIESMKITGCISRSKRHDLPISPERIPFAVYSSRLSSRDAVGTSRDDSSPISLSVFTGLKQGQALTGRIASARGFELGRFGMNYSSMRAKDEEPNYC
jgi:hypothetical protein